MKIKTITHLVMTATLSILASNAQAAAPCPVSYDDLEEALSYSLTADNGGLNFDMWGAVVNRDGVVCAVIKVDGQDTGTNVDPWPGSRVIAAQKANTANAFSNDQLSLSTANLFSAVQPGASLFGLQHSNPVDTNAAYAGAGTGANGTSNDPMIGSAIGGVNVFGGGLALYDTSTGKLVGALGVSGDTSCADHNIAMKLRYNLGFDWGPGGIDDEATDNMVYQGSIGDPNGFEPFFNHPGCGFHAELINDSVINYILANPL